MLANISQNELGPVVNIDGFHALIPANDTAMAQVITAAEGLVTSIVQLSETTKEEKMAEVVRQSTAGKVAEDAISVAYSALVQRKRDAEKADRSTWERSPTASDDRMDAQWCAFYRDLGPGEQVARIADAKLPELAAVALNADLARLGPEARALVADRYIALNWAEKVGLAGGYPNQPSLDGDVLATGVDHAAVERAALVALEQHRARLEQSKTDEATVRGLIAMLAVAFGQTEQEILERIKP